MLVVSLGSWALLALGFSLNGVVGSATIFLAFAVFVIGNFVVRVAFRCPNCGTPIFHRTGPISVAWPVKICQVCGHDVRVRRT